MLEEADTSVRRARRSRPSRSWASSQALTHLLDRRRQQANYDRHLLDYDQFFHQEKPATNQIEFVIVKRPALSILCLRGHGALLCRPARLSFPFTSNDRMPSNAPRRCSLGN